jgi:hypothetical protein
MRGSLARILAIVLVISSSGFAQNIPFYDSAYVFARALTLQTPYPLQRDFNGSGARAKGMGNAFLGVSDDVNAASWNPAGLYRHEDPYLQPVMALGYQSFSADASFRDRPYLDVPWSQFEFSETYSGWDLMSLVWPMRIKGHMFVGAVSFNRLGDEAHNSGMSIDANMPYDNDDIIAGIERPYHYENLVFYRSYINALHIGFGTRLYDKLSFGLTVNTYGGKGSQNTFETIVWDELIIPNSPSDQRGVGEIVNSVYDTTEYSGVYFTLGFKYNGDKLSAGLAVKTPHTLKETHDVFVNPVAYVNGVVEDGFGQSIHIDDNVVELDQPLMIGLGFGYRATENLLVAADVEYRGYGGGEVHRRDSISLVPGGTDVEYFTDFDPEWNSTWVMRAGTEYIWNTGSRIFPTVPLRAGFSYVPIPEPDIEGFTFDNSDMLIPSYGTAATTRWSLGTGVRWAQIHLDMAYVISSLERSNVWLDQESTVDDSSLNFTFTGYF